MKKKLIIGGSGFIGKYLIKSMIKNGSQVINFDKTSLDESLNNMPTIIGDVRQESDFSNIPDGINCIYILSAVHKDDIRDKNKYYETNHLGVKNIIKYADYKQINEIVFFSSAAVYGESFYNSSEIDELNPKNHYGKSKYLAEKELCKWVGSNMDKKLIIIRPSVVYGKNSNSNMNRMIDFISKNKFVMVGSGENIKSSCYVENLVSFTNYYIKKSSLGKNVCNYADTPNYSINDLAFEISKQFKSKVYRLPYFLAYGIGLFFDLISFISRKKFHISSTRIKKVCSNTYLSIDKVEKTGFKPPYSFSESINKTIR